MVSVISSSKKSIPSRGSMSHRAANAISAWIGFLGTLLLTDIVVNTAVVSSSLVLDFIEE